MWRAAVNLLIGLWLVAGCSPQPAEVRKDLDTQAQAWIARTSEELLRAKGPPDSIERLRNGDSVWLYKDRKYDNEREIYIAIGLVVYDSASAPADHVGTTRFLVGADGRIKSYRTSVD